MVSSKDASDVHQVTDELLSDTKRIARRWADTPYYNAVENTAYKQWEDLILPFFGVFRPDLEHVLELAQGHGRFTEIFLRDAGFVTAVDVNSENIMFCKERFGDLPNLRLIENDGVTLKEIDNNSISFVFCFDSMVHFDSDIVRIYLREFRRVMRDGASGFLHHSNFTKNPGGDFQRSRHARNFMSSEMFAHYALKEGLAVVKQEVIDWGSGEKFSPSLDGLALLKKVA